MQVPKLIIDGVLK